MKKPVLQLPILTALLLCLCIFCANCGMPGQGKETGFRQDSLPPVVREDSILGIPLSQIPLSPAFDFPVGPPDAKGYYNAQGFQKGTTHLGDDWNGVGGGNSDLGDPVFSVAKGIVCEAADWGGGWGNVLRVLHNIGSDSQPKIIEFLYAHLDKMLVEKGHILEKGEQLGTIGTANGAYPAHLHLELRKQAGMDLGGGYSEDTTGFADPTAFIKSHRGH